MYKIKNNKQIELFDPRSFLSPKRSNLLDKSWAGLFCEEIPEELPVEKLIPFFKESGRPSKELYTVLGALLLQQFFDYTDEETIAQLSFNIQWHYSLNITEKSDSVKYFCERTLWKMRKITGKRSCQLWYYCKCHCTRVYRNRYDLKDVRKG